MAGRDRTKASFSSGRSGARHRSPTVAATADARPGRSPESSQASAPLADRFVELDQPDRRRADRQVTCGTGLIPPGGRRQPADNGLDPAAAPQPRDRAVGKPPLETATGVGAEVNDWIRQDAAAGGFVVDGTGEHVGRSAGERRGEGQYPVRRESAVDKHLADPQPCRQRAGLVEAEGRCRAEPQKGVTVAHQHMPPGRCSDRRPEGHRCREAKRARARHHHHGDRSHRAGRETGPAPAGEPAVGDERCHRREEHHRQKPGRHAVRQSLVPRAGGGCGLDGTDQPLERAGARLRGDLDEQWAVDHLGATGHRRLESSCSSIGSSGRVVPERPGDDLSTQSASGGPSWSAAPGLLVSMRRNSATASFNGTAQLSTGQQSTQASRSIFRSSEIPGRRRGSTCVHFSEAVLTPSAKGTTGQCLKSAT